MMRGRGIVLAGPGAAWGRLIAVVFIVAAQSAAATQPLPTIVTYEMQRRSEAASIERRDPKTFWVRQIMARLEDRKPAGALGLKQPATATVGFVVARDGRITSKTIQTTSGVPAVDGEALAMLERAQPFPPMPPALADSEIAFSLPLRFR